MCLLDQPEDVLKHDSKGIYALVHSFPEQCQEALAISKGASLSPLSRAVEQVVLTGLGGSAAGGDLARSLFEAYGKVPFIVNRDYTLPAWVGPGTLVICASYSGNTEETLSAFADAQAKGAQILAVTSGGEIGRLATDGAHTAILIPAGQPPRTALGYLLVPVLFACQKYGLIPEQPFESTFRMLDSCREMWRLESNLEQNSTKQMALAIQGKLPLLYGLGSWQAAVANRWKGQINENAKMMAFANAFPELCHNEIIGWVGATSQGVNRWVTVVLQDGSETAKMKARARVTLQLVSDRTERYEVHAPGTELLEKMLALTYYGDFLSVYVAALNGVDPENIDHIHTLKSELAQVE